MPTPWAGVNCLNGKKNPVTLVATVVARKSAVQPSSRFPLSSPNMTTNPEPIPNRLITTCMKVSVWRLKIIICVLSEFGFQRKTLGARRFKRARLAELLDSSQRVLSTSARRKRCVTRGVFIFTPYYRWSEQSGHHEIESFFATTFD